MLDDTINAVDLLDASNPKFWFCVRTHPKHEHIAARCLKKAGEIEVFNPQIRINRATKRGPVWFTESAFPCYIFARFNLRSQLETVRYSPSVTRVVHFSSGYPRIPDFQMNELRSVFSNNDTVVSSSNPAVGDTVRIVGGAFHDLLAVVQNIHLAKQRVFALLDFLGRLTPVELGFYNVNVESRGAAAFHPLNLHPTA